MVPREAKRPDLQKLDDRAVILALEDNQVTFRRSLKDKHLRKLVVSEAKMLPVSKDFGRVVQMRTREGTFSVPLDYVEEITPT